MLLRIHDWICFIFSILQVLTLVNSREVSFIEDLCRRFPKLEYCTSSRKEPPTLPPTREQQKIDKETYCKQYQLHYTYFCSTDTNQNANARDFCSAYNKECDTKAAPAIWSPEQIEEQCNKRRSLAQQYCTGNEIPAIKSDCDLYRKYCVGGADKGSPPTAIQQPSLPVQGNVQQYCQSNLGQYQAQCTRQLVRPTGPQQQTVGSGQQQPPPATPTGAGGAGGLSQSEINNLCTSNKALASQFCTGNEVVPNIRQQCDLWRTYCISKVFRRFKRDNGMVELLDKRHKRQLPGVASNFCQEYVQNCNNLSWQDSQLGTFCAKYSFMQDTFCPAYEIAENRIACNAHRYYCQGKQPFRDIDGISGF